MSDGDKVKVNLKPPTAQHSIDSVEQQRRNLNEVKDEGFFEIFLDGVIDMVKLNAYFWWVWATIIFVGLIIAWILWILFGFIGLYNDILPGDKVELTENRKPIFSDDSDSEDVVNEGDSQSEEKLSDELSTKQHTGNEADIIRFVAERDGFEDAELLVNIANCESGFSSLAVNGEKAGVFQFTPDKFAEFTEGKLYGNDDRYDLGIATEGAIYFLNNDDTTPWDASRSCWEK